MCSCRTWAMLLTLMSLATDPASSSPPSFKFVSNMPATRLKTTLSIFLSRRSNNPCRPRTLRNLNSSSTRSLGPNEPSQTASSCLRHLLRACTTNSSTTAHRNGKERIHIPLAPLDHPQLSSKIIVHLNQVSATHTKRGRLRKPGSTTNNEVRTRRSCHLLPVTENTPPPPRDLVRQRLHQGKF